MQVRTSTFFKSKRHLLRALSGAAALVVLVAAGAALLHFTEGTDWLDCVYWALTTLSTVGAPRRLFARSCSPYRAPSCRLPVRRNARSTAAPLPCVSSKARHLDQLGQPGEVQQ